MDLELTWFRAPLSGMCTAGQTKWQLMIRESPQRFERTLVTSVTARNMSRNSELVKYYARFFEQMMLTACNVVAHQVSSVMPFSSKDMCFIIYNIAYSIV